MVGQRLEILDASFIAYIHATIRLCFRASLIYVTVWSDTMDIPAFIRLLPDLQHQAIIQIFLSYNGTSAFSSFFEILINNAKIYGQLLMTASLYVDAL